MGVGIAVLVIALPLLDNLVIGIAIGVVPGAMSNGRNKRAGIWEWLNRADIKRNLYLKLA